MFSTKLSLFPAPAQVDPSVLTPLSQQRLSMALEDVTLSEMLDPAEGLLERERAHLQLAREPGSGAWLFAIPSFALGNAITGVPNKPPPK